MWKGSRTGTSSSERGRVVYGASYRNTRVNTSGTLMSLADDNRSDDYYSGYGQVEYKLLPSSG